MIALTVRCVLWHSSVGDNRKGEKNIARADNNTNRAVRPD